VTAGRAALDVSRELAAEFIVKLLTAERRRGTPMAVHFGGPGSS
jgi:hypothetical protein